MTEPQEPQSLVGPWHEVATITSDHAETTISDGAGRFIHLRPVEVPGVLDALNQVARGVRVRPPEEPPPDGAALRAEWLQTRLDGSFVAAQDAFVERLLVALESIPAPLRGPSPTGLELKRAVAEWIRLKGDYPTAADADHSALLERLLSGKLAFPFKPPRRYSYPDYALAGGESVVVSEFYVRDGKIAVVDQSAWNIIERAQDNHYLLEWPEEPGSRYVLQPNRKGQPPEVLVLAEYNGFVIQRAGVSRGAVSPEG